MKTRSKQKVCEECEHKESSHLIGKTYSNIGLSFGRGTKCIEYECTCDEFQNPEQMEDD